MYIDQTGEQVTLTRDCDAIQVPNGTRMKLPAGTTGTITQALGGTYTVITNDNYMVRIQSKDADALGREATGPITEQPASDAPEDVEKAVWDQLRTCYDPEIPVNIVDLGLVYDVQVADQKVDVKMTLTARGCGMGGYIASEAEQKLMELPGVEEAKVEVVWDPPWEPSMISLEARKTLGMPED